MSRLDSALVERHIAKSRTLAQSLIKDGAISVNGTICDKPSFSVSDSDGIELLGELPKYVSRGGLKLEKAVNEFSIELNGLVCLDIGASTGGFTDCMLQNGAKKVYAVDVGTNQLDQKLRGDERVVSLEKTDIRSFTSPEQIDFISIDVSFISLKTVLPCAFSQLKENGKCVALIKPQFEAGRKALNKNGIVTDAKIRENVVAEIKQFCADLGFLVIGTTNSAIKGGDGNVEFLIFLAKGECK